MDLEGSLLASAVPGVEDSLPVLPVGRPDPQSRLSSLSQRPSGGTDKAVGIKLSPSLIWAFRKQLSSRCPGHATPLPPNIQACIFPSAQFQANGEKQQAGKPGGSGVSSRKVWGELQGDLGVSSREVWG